MSNEIKLKLNEDYSRSAYWGLIDGRFTQSESYEFEEVEGGEYEQDGKYQYATSIVKCLRSPNELEVNKFFMVNDSRSGSYHSDWYYDTEWDKDVTLRECIQVEKVIKSWEVVK